MSVLLPRPKRVWTRLDIVQRAKRGSQTRCMLAVPSLVAENGTRGSILVVGKTPGGQPATSARTRNSGHSTYSTGARARAQCRTGVLRRSGGETAWLHVQCRVEMARLHVQRGEVVERCQIEVEPVQC